MLSFDFIIKGTPVSQQTRKRKRLREWKDKVRASAAARWPSGSQPLNQAIKISAVYFFEGVALDTDNMLKPIQDALKGIIYSDDCVVTDSQAAKRDLNGNYRVKGMSPVLAEGFCYGSEFIYVKLVDAPSQEELL